MATLFKTICHLRFQNTLQFLQSKHLCVSGT